jgi:radical SAM superfamily enzyme YgiQ (UPF0313 family)
MKVMLYFPPLVVASVKNPYPSLSILSSYLKENSNHEVLVKDINVDFINNLINISEQNIKSNNSISYNRIIRNKISLLVSLILSKRIYNYLYVRFIRLRYRPFRSKKGLMHLFRAKTQQINLLLIEKHVIEGLKIIFGLENNIDYETMQTLKTNDARFECDHYLLDYWNLKFNQIFNIINSEFTDKTYSSLGLDYFNEVKQDEKQLIGISVAFFTQFGAAISLAKHIKKINPRAFVVIGGPVIRHVSAKFPKITQLFDIVDCFVETEGEDILLELANKIEKNEDWHNIPGIIIRDIHGNILKNPEVQFDIRKNGIPDYSFVTNHKYLVPDALYLRTSIGCYWNKCKFCTQALNKYKQRSVETIVDDMIKMSEKYHCNFISLSDETVPFTKIVKIAELIIKKRLNILWTTYSRFETKFTLDQCKKIVRSGCDFISFGLESANQRVNDLMNKGVSIANVTENLNVFRKLRFGCAIGAIIGFPGETEQEMHYTADFLNSYIQENKGVTGYISNFSLNAGSYVYNHPQEYGISSIENADEYFYKENYNYKSTNQVPYERMMEIANLVNMQSMSKVVFPGPERKAVTNRDNSCDRETPAPENLRGQI